VRLLLQLRGQSCVLDPADSAETINLAVGKQPIDQPLAARIELHHILQLTHLHGAFGSVLCSRGAAVLPGSSAVLEALVSLFVCTGGHTRDHTGGQMDAATAFKSSTSC